MSLSQATEHDAARVWAGDGTVCLWDVDFAAGLPILKGHTKYVYPVAFSPDGRWIASGGWDNVVCLWDAVTGELGATLPQPGIVRALAYAPDGSWLVCGGDFPNGPLLWDVATGQLRGRIPAEGKSIWSLAVSPDGTRVAVGANVRWVGYTMSVWDVTTEREVATAAGLPFAFSPDGKWLAGRENEGNRVVLWDTQDFRPVAHWPGHAGTINSLAFDRTGGRLLSASNDRTVRLWSTATGECVRVFSGHTDDVFTAVFHPDGTRIASAGRDRAVWIWAPDREQEVARLPGHTSYVWSVAFSPDGKTLVSGSGDTRVRLWDTEPLRVRHQARREAVDLRPEAERLAERLFREKQNAAGAVAAVRSDPTLSDSERAAALQAVLRRSTGGPKRTPRARTGPPHE